jgi:hypothetical protein
MKKLDSVLCGVAGEYFVAAELTRLGYIASITLRNTRGVDILASNRDATKSVAIQVKTNQRGTPEWILTEKIEREITSEELPENLFFVFVNLPPDGSPPTYHVISRREVALHAQEGHQRWLAAPRRDGSPHSSNNPIRKFKDPEGKYQNAWSTLGLD